MRFALQRLYSPGASVQSAWLDLRGGPTLHFRSLSVPDRFSAQEADFRLAPLKWLAGGRALALVTVSRGRFTFGQSSSAGGKSARPLDAIAALSVQDLELVYARRDRPHRFIVDEATGSLAEGTLRLRGHGPRTFVTFDGDADLAARRTLGGRLFVQGANFAEAFDLIGLAAPDTPPFRLEGKLTLDNRIWSLQDLSGNVGDSDLAGSFSVDPRGRRPFVRAALRSKRLDFDDVGILIGAPSGVGRGETNEEQRAANAQYRADARLIPDARLDFSRLDRINADVTFHAASVSTGYIPLTAVSTHMTLTDRVLSFTPLVFETKRGNLSADIEIDARQDPAISTVKGQVANLGLEQFARGRIMKGRLGAGIDLKLQGSDFRAAAASADGNAALWASNAQIREIAVEGAGLELGKALLTWLAETGGQPKMEPVRCLAARLAIKKGLGTLSPAVLDTEDSLISASGTLNLKTEALNLSFDADPKTASWGRLLGDVKLTGTLRRPRTSANLAKAAPQGALAALLSALAAPLAALPFFETGGGHDAPCAELLARAKSASGR